MERCKAPLVCHCPTCTLFRDSSLFTSQRLSLAYQASLFETLKQSARTITEENRNRAEPMPPLQSMNLVYETAISNGLLQPGTLDSQVHSSNRNPLSQMTSTPQPAPSPSTHEPELAAGTMSTTVQTEVTFPAFCTRSVQTEVRCCANPTTKIVNVVPIGTQTTSPGQGTDLPPHPSPPDHMIWPAELRLCAIRNRRRIRKEHLLRSAGKKPTMPPGILIQRKRFQKHFRRLQHTRKKITSSLKTLKEMEELTDTHGGYFFASKHGISMLGQDRADIKRTWSNPLPLGAGPYHPVAGLQHRACFKEPDSSEAESTLGYIQNT